MREASEKGYPVMRTLFFEFPQEKESWNVEDECMFGSKYLVAPVLYEGMRERDVWLPKGKWRDIRDGKVYRGGVSIRALAPLDEIPVYEKL